MPEARQTSRGDQRSLAQKLLRSERMAISGEHRRDLVILIVDDEDDERELIADVLRDAGYTPETATNGREALALLASIDPAAVLLDVEMPLMNGAEMREQMRRDRRLASIPTIVMTAHAREPVLDPGVRAVLHKPFGERRLLSVVDDVLKDE